MADEKQAQDVPKKKELTSADWINRIRRSLKYRDTIRDKQEWKTNLEMYEGDYKIGGQAIKSPPINLVYGYIQTLISKIYFRDPYMSVSPKGGAYIKRANILETVINYIFGELGLKGQVERVLMDTGLVAHGWLKFGYSSSVGEMAGEVPNESSEYIKNEDIFVCYVPWTDIVFDTALAKDPPHDCSWIAHRIVRPLEDVQQDSRFNNAAALQANVSNKDDSNETKDTDKSEEDDQFEYWEIFDMKRMEIKYAADGVEGYLAEKPNIYEMEGPPFAMLAFNRINGKPYPIADITLIKAQILERIRLRAAQLNHIKRWSRQLSIEIGAMTELEMQKFSEGVDGAVTQRAKGFAPPEPIQYAPIPPESFELDSLIQQDIDGVIGQNDVDRGGQARTTTKTKYELVQQQEGSGGRQSKRQDVLEDFLEEVAMKIIALLKQFQTTERYVQITGMKPEEIAEAFGQPREDGSTMKTDESGIYFTKDDIQGDYDVDAKAGSTLPMNRQNRVQTINMLLDPAVGQTIGVLPGSPVAMELGRELIRELDLKGAEKAYDQQIAQMEDAAKNPQPPAPQPEKPPQEPSQVIVTHVNAPPGLGAGALPVGGGPMMPPMMG